MSPADQKHWDHRYTTVGAVNVSWYEDSPDTSLALLDAVGVTTADSVVDVGGGASRLVDALVGRGHTDLAVLDLSSVALDVARQRVGHDAPVTWLERDLLSWEPARTWDVWHDRAVLHFLLSDDDRARYVATLRQTVGPGGAFVIGTFAEDGPIECSALPVRRSRPVDLASLVPGAEIVDTRRHVHVTPAGAPQPFNWIAGRVR